MYLTKSQGMDVTDVEEVLKQVNKYHAYSTYEESFLARFHSKSHLLVLSSIKRYAVKTTSNQNESKIRNVISSFY